MHTVCGNLINIDLVLSKKKPIGNQTKNLRCLEHCFNPLLIHCWSTSCTPWINIWIWELYKSYLMVVKKGPMQKLPHIRSKCRGGGGHSNFWTMSKRKPIFFWWLPLVLTFCGSHNCFDVFDLICYGNSIPKSSVYI